MDPQHFQRILDRLQGFHQECEDPSTRLTCLDTLKMMLTQLLENPLDLTYNKIDMRNDEFVFKVGQWNQAMGILEFVGYAIISDPQGNRFFVVDEPDPMKLAAAKIAIEASIQVHESELSGMAPVEEEPASSSADVGASASSSGFQASSSTDYGQIVQQYYENNPIEENDDGSEDNCAFCGGEGELLLCDSCPKAFHINCVQMTSVPAGDWFCPYCVSAQQKQDGGFNENNVNIEILSMNDNTNTNFNSANGVNNYINISNGNMDNNNVTPTFINMNSGGNDSAYPMQQQQQQ